MAEIITLGRPTKHIAAEPNQKIIAELEAMLQEARAGRIQCLVAVHTDGDSACSISADVGEGREQALIFIGSLEVVKHSLLVTMLETNS